MLPLRRVGAQLALLLALCPAACGEAPTAPPPPPKEFDDLDDLEAPEVAAAPGDAAPAVPDPAPSATVAAQPTPGEAPAPADPLATNADAPASGTLVPATDTPAVKPSAVEPASAATKPTPDPKATKKPGPSAPTPAPADSPAPAPAPAPPPVPEPAPVATPEPAPVATPAPPPVPPQQRFAGTFRFAGGDAQRTELAAAIDTAVQELNALIRGIGRKRLTESNVIRDTITIAVDGDKVTTTFAPGRTVSAKLEGASVPWTSDTGKPLTVKFSMVKGRLVQTFTADDGGRRSVFTLNEAGDRMTLSVTITSERLTNPLKYALSYKRD
jgi:hypothetical protein